MRFDTAGLFWDDTPPPRVTKPAPPKRTPPERTWEAPDYLPGLAEALAFDVPLMTAEDLQAAYEAREILICDTEIYENYFLCAFTSFATGKCIYFEMEGNEAMLDVHRIRWILENFTIVTFNGHDFDLPVLALALSQYNCSQLKFFVNLLIYEQIKPWILLRSRKVKALRVDHIDLIEVAPLQASLKIYGGRLHVPRMQDLPFHHATILSLNQVAIVRYYCVNDLTSTCFLYKELRPQIELRAKMSLQYGVDLRSKSDAQIADAVIISEIQRKTYSRPERPEVAPGSIFRYKVPGYVRFQTPVLHSALLTTAAASFVIGENGAAIMPPELAEMRLTIGSGTYQMGIGGLHSCETCAAHYADDNFELVDRDVTSYYPNIILNQGLYPAHIGPAFLEVYKDLVDRRQLAKLQKLLDAHTLKIVVNGAFGKLGSKWSVLFAPDLMIQVTISGQLTLLMLIERLELTGIQVCSGNTDGLLIRCEKAMRYKMLEIVKQWEVDTGFTTEETGYHAVFARDVNNYFAVKLDGSIKVKGSYCERGSAGDSVLSKNPESLICSDAVAAFLTKGIPIADTIWSCRDVRRLITVRTVKGGAVKDGVYLGKAIRWYYARDMAGEIIYASNGNKVPLSDGARPCMELPQWIPHDVDFTRYERDALGILAEIGYPMPGHEKAPAA